MIYNDNNDNMDMDRQFALIGQKFNDIVLENIVYVKPRTPNPFIYASNSYNGVIFGCIR